MLDNRHAVLELGKIKTVVTYFPMDGAQSNDLKTAYRGRNYSTQTIQKIVGVRKIKIVRVLRPSAPPPPNSSTL